MEKANVVVDHLEGSIRPIERELHELQEKIRNLEHIEEISQQAKQLKKKLAWSWVYDVDRQLQQKNVHIGKLKDRIPLCQAKIDQFRVSISSWLLNFSMNLACQLIDIFLNILWQFFVKCFYVDA